MVEAMSQISNFSSLFVHPTDTINLTCNIEAAQQTDFVYWYKNKETIQFDNLKLRHSTTISKKKKKKENSNNNNNNEDEDDDDDGGAKHKSNKGKQVKSTFVQAGREKPFDHERLDDQKAYKEENNDFDFAKDERISAENNELDSDITIGHFRSSSSLIIKRASSNDTANYTCLVSRLSQVVFYVVAVILVIVIVWAIAAYSLDPSHLAS